MIPAIPKRVLRLGILNIWRHRLRSILTILGVVFGVSSFIAMLAIGEGASYEAQQQIKRLGSKNIIIKSVPPPESGEVNAEAGRMKEYGIKYKDMERIELTLPNVEILVPSRTIRSEVIYRTRKVDANAVGTIPSYPTIAKKTISEGRFFNDLEMTDRKNVCVLGAEVARRLFQFESPMGKTIKIRNDYFTVIGVVESMGSALSDGSGNQSPLDIYIPITAAKARFGDTIMNRGTGSFDIEKVELHEVIVKVSDAADVISSAETIRGVLKRSHKDEDYEIIVPLELLRQAKRTKRIFNIVLGSIAAISLLVGGIGIMNIMLASVTERTREIGIRRALGAKRRDIIIQFLIETVLLSSCGGGIGLLLGILLPFFITHFSGMETIIRLWALAGAFAISVFIGIVFGMYPAYRASVMSPISALRRE